jgi:hypothetical protein
LLTTQGVLEILANLILVYSFWVVLFFAGPESVTLRVLLAFVFPGHIIFAMVIALFNAGHTSITPMFLITYLTAAFLQVSWLCRST